MCVETGVCASIVFLNDIFPGRMPVSQSVVM